MTDTGSPSPPRRPRGSPEERANELAARKRVAALVSGSLHFKVKREGDQIQAHRGASATKVINRLTSKTFSPEVTLDLRGQATSKLRDAIPGFVTLHHRRGVQQMSILFDPPVEGETESALDAIVAALTLGSAAALVRGFASARETPGVKNALALLLI